jgi:hypothetical protein
MKPLNARLTQKLFDLTVKFPKMFPRWMKNKFYPFTMELYGKNTADSFYNRANILDGDGRCTSINITTSITHKELVRLYKKVKAESSADISNTPPEILPTESPEHAIIPFSSIPLNNTYPYGTYKFKVKSQKFRMCTFTTIHLSSDSIYLSIDLELNEGADRDLFDVDISNIPEYYFFKTFNPFSKNFLAIQSSYSIIQEKIVTPINRMAVEAKTSAMSLMKAWGIHAEMKNLILSGHFINSPDIDCPIARPLGDTITHNYHLLSRTNERICDQYKSHQDDTHYLYNFDIENLLLSSIYIDNNDGRIIPRDYYQSHLYLSLIIDIESSYKKTRNSTNPFLLKINKNTEKDLQHLFEANLETKLIKKRAIELKTMIESYYFSPFQKYALEEIERLSTNIENLLQAIDERKILSNEQMQLKNLKFNKHYSLLVAGLALLQVILAAIVIDWNPATPTLNPVIKNFTYVSEWVLAHFQ